MLRSRNKGTLLALIVALVPIIACSDSTDPGNGGTPQDFTGTYTLVSLSQGNAAGVIEVPGSTGTVTLTATNYDVTFTLPQVPPAAPLIIDDEGTYSAVGTATAGSWSQQSSLNASLQYAGSYTYDAGTDRLTLDTTALGIRTVLVLEMD